MTSGDLHSFRLQHQAVTDGFSRQASHWALNEITPDLLWAVDLFKLEPSSKVLDVAAGTGLLSRAISKRVRQVIALDLTSEMLHQGRAEAIRGGFTNIEFNLGAAEALPYRSSSFNAVVTRFSLHHMKDPAWVVHEMRRVCCDEGKVAVIDLIAPQDKTLASAYNQFERLRDPSHTVALSTVQMENLFHELGVYLTSYEVRDVEMNMTDWLDFANTEGGARRTILEAVNSELNGEGETGLRPFISNGDILFRHRWGVAVGECFSERRM